MLIPLSQPTLSHTFIRLLHDKQRLVRVYTQNVDCLEVTAGVPQEKVIEVHGSFRDAYCSVCSAPADVAALRSAPSFPCLFFANARRQPQWTRTRSCTARAAAPSSPA